MTTCPLPTLSKNEILLPLSSCPSSLSVQTPWICCFDCQCRIKTANLRVINSNPAFSAVSFGSFAYILALASCFTVDPMILVHVASIDIKSFMGKGSEGILVYTKRAIFVGRVEFNLLSTECRD